MIEVLNIKDSIILNNNKYNNKKWVVCIIKRMKFKRIRKETLILKIKILYNNLWKVVQPPKPHKTTKIINI